ncbi:MAG: gluconate 2-dehydrogenase subunit 3 family protein [Bryobacteraceae bacterium]
MKRRSVLQSLVALPALAGAQSSATAQKDLTAAREKGLPAGPPLVPPGINETPITPVVAADETAKNVNTTFNPEQLSALVKLGELLVPSWNGRPGAMEAGAAEFLDFLVGCSPKSRIELYRNGLNTLNRSAQQRFGKMFTSIESAQADSLLTPLREPWTFQSANSDSLSAFLEAAKGDLLRATLNSRPYIDALSQTRRPRNASRFYWYPIS